MAEAEIVERSGVLNEQSIILNERKKKHESPDDRPCKKVCSPDEGLVVIHLHERVAAVQQYIENASETPDVHLIAVILTACVCVHVRNKRQGIS